jgi:hypothetical protein
MSPVTFFLANCTTPRIWAIDDETVVPPVDDSSDWQPDASPHNGEEDRYEAYCDQKYESVRTASDF